MSNPNVYIPLEGDEYDNYLFATWGNVNALHYVGEYNVGPVTWDVLYSWDRTINAGGGDDTIVRDRPGDYKADAKVAENIEATPQSTDGHVGVYGGEGNDTINYQLFQGSMEIDLRPMGQTAADAYSPFVQDYFDVADAGYAKMTGLNGQTIYGMDFLHSIENVIATDWDDKVTGNDEANTIEGRDGNDTINGEGGNDYLYGDGGDDVIHGGDGYDVILGGDGVDTIWGDAGDDVILGGDDNDTLYGGDGIDTIAGGDGQDKIFGGDLTDYLYGHGGNDTIHGDLGDDELSGGAGIDRLYGDAGADTIWGGDDADIVFGGSGDDTIHGGNGGDKLFGGSGQDTIHGDDGKDTLKGGQNNDTLFGGDDDDKLYGQGGADTLHGGSGHDTMYGGSGHDTMYGDNGIDTMFGGDGVDTMYGNDGADTMNGGRGSDYMFGGEHNDTLNGGDGSDYMYGGNGNDFLWGGASDEATDFMYGGNGNDTFFVEKGAEKIDGGSGFDKVVMTDAENGMHVYVDGFGNGYMDSYSVSQIPDVAQGYTEFYTELKSVEAFEGTDMDDTIEFYTLFGNNSAWGKGGNDTISLGSGSDMAWGGEGDDDIFGGGHDDTLFGDEGADTIRGGAGVDTMTGGSGADTFVWTNSDGDGSIDVITDFELGSDTLDIDGLLANPPSGFALGVSPDYSGEVFAVATNFADNLLFANTDDGWKPFLTLQGYSAETVNNAIDNGVLFNDANEQLGALAESEDPLSVPDDELFTPLNDALEGFDYASGFGPLAGHTGHLQVADIFM